MAGALAGSDSDSEAAFKRRLRRLRQRVLLRTMARDLENRADLEEVCTAMSDLADLSLRAALRWLREDELIVVAMGKLGGRELNVSSDIDLVFVHPGTQEKPADQPKLERTGRKLIALLNDVTEDGFVFRVDMRLRPYGASGALVSSFDALEAYFVSQGREWERYAWIKARPISGTQFDELAAIVRPFVYRKYLDFGTLEAMRRLHAEVRRDVARRELAEHVKLGPGGIRDRVHRPGAATGARRARSGAHRAADARGARAAGQETASARRGRAGACGRLRFPAPHRTSPAVPG